MTNQNTSQVFFSPTRGEGRGVVYHQLPELFKAAGADKAITDNDIVAIKMHFGELSDTHYIRPIIAQRMVELVKECGGRPFLTDTTSLYRHQRHTPFLYLETARKNGFSPHTMGCPIIIADGYKNNGTLVPVDSPNRLDEVRVAQAIYESDVLIDMAHVTLHSDFPIAAAIKNLGMGCTTKEFKIKMHSTHQKPRFNPDKCLVCGACLRVCPGEAFIKVGKKIQFLPDNCLSCGDCIAWCKGGAIDIAWHAFLKDVQAGTFDAFKAVVSTFGAGKVKHFNFALDITHLCDCGGGGEVIVPDIGILASDDGLAIDKAAFDMFQASEGIKGSIIDEKGAAAPAADKVKAMWPGVDSDAYWQLAKKSNIGNLNYQIIRI